MKKQIKKDTKAFLLKAVKVVGFLLIIFVLFAVYQSLFLGKSNYRQKSVSKDYQRSELALPMVGGMVAEEAVSVEMEDSAGMAFESKAMNSDVVIGDGNYIPTNSSDKKVIKNGYLTLKVEDTDTAAEEITNIVKRNGGEVFSSNFNEYSRGSKTGSITVKVPVDKFQQAVKELKGVATQVISESTSGQDVTERYVDLKAQLKNKKAEEATFVSLLDRSGKLDDVLKVSREIARVRGEIERLEGKIKYLESQTSMSTITINVSEDVEVTPVSDDWRPAQVVKKALNDLKKQAQDFVDGLIRFIIVTIPSLIPFVLFLIVVLWIGKKFFHSFMRK